MSVCVCLPICSLAYLMNQTFKCFVHGPVSCGAETSYALAVLWMTSRLPVIAARQRHAYKACTQTNSPEGSTGAGRSLMDIAY